MYEKGQTVELTTQRKVDVNGEWYTAYYPNSGANHSTAEGTETVTLTTMEARLLNRDSWFIRYN